MLIVYFKYECAKCGKWFESPHLDEMVSYGQFLMRSEKGDITYLEAIGDVVFKEFSDMLAVHPLLSELDEGQIATILHQTFGWTCDLAPDGTRYGIMTQPNCPTCGKVDIANWGPVAVPPPFVNVHIKPISHHEWNQLPKAEKWNVIDKALRDIIIKSLYYFENENLLKAAHAFYFKSKFPKLWKIAKDA